MEMPMRRTKADSPSNSRIRYDWQLQSQVLRLLDTGKMVDTLSQDFMEVQRTSGGAIKQTLRTDRHPGCVGSRSS